MEIHRAQIFFQQFPIFEISHFCKAYPIQFLQELVTRDNVLDH